MYRIGAFVPTSVSSFASFGLEAGYPSGSARMALVNREISLLFTYEKPKNRGQALTPTAPLHDLDIVFP